MRVNTLALASSMAIGLTVALPKPSYGHDNSSAQKPITNIQLGPRPYYLVNDLPAGPLKKKLQSCSEKKIKKTNFSIGHRGGGTLQIPEETTQGMLAGARMGIGINECDVAFTSDRQLVCRHAQCDLHTTTNIVTIPELNAKCTTPFTAALANGTAATAKCCTSDITAAEFKTLCGKMDGFNASATTPEDFLHGTPAWRTELYDQCGTVLTHKEYITLTDELGLDFTPELKTPEVEMPFEGDYTQEIYAQQMIDEYKEAGIAPKRVWAQSFLIDDVYYWLKSDPAFGAQAVLLDESGDTVETFPGAVANLTNYRKAGINVIAPPLPYLVTLDKDGKIIPSVYATTAKELGFKIITWSLERSPPPHSVPADEESYYYASVQSAIKTDGDIYTLVDVLAREVGVIGIFSDWAATVTYYANCFGL